MIHSSLDLSLKGFEIGISGAVPSPEDWTEPLQDRAILEFVSVLSGLVIKYGGRIIHGAHPSFTQVILRQAQEHQRADSRKAVSIYISELWAKNTDANDLERMRSIAEVTICPQPISGLESDPQVRNAALSSMRKTLVNSMNTIVAVGGKVHRGNGLIPGVKEELALAQKREMPCFLVGGFGGMAAALAGEIDSTLFKNNLSDGYNEALLSSADISATVNIIFSHLAHSKELLDRDLMFLE